MLPAVRGMEAGWTECFETLETVLGEMGGRRAGAGMALASWAITAPVSIRRIAVFNTLARRIADQRCMIRLASRCRISAPTDGALLRCAPPEHQDTHGRAGLGVPGAVHADRRPEG
jgi:hypothetical protein